MDLPPLSAKGLVKFIRLRIIVLVGVFVVSLLSAQLIGAQPVYAAGGTGAARDDVEIPVPGTEVNPQTGSQSNEASALDAGVAYIILLFAGLLHIIATALGHFALWIIELLVVPVLQYNNFSDSVVIANGWSLVRDVVNMFVVLILIVIAVSTIVGYEKAHWQKSLPQFLLAVVMVNFSRTICGLLIDVSQVIMFTFVNALLDVVAGNFAKMLGIDSFGAYSNSIITGDSASLKVIEASGQLGAAFLELVLYIVIAIVLLLLMLAFIWRIVVLWVLVVMSPLTFFASGIGGLFKIADSIGGEWWKKFTAALTLGPMLTFFLWLSLTTATTGITEGFNVKDIKTDPPRLLESFDNSRLLATFLGIAILIIGVQQSAASAGSLGGLAKKYLGDPKLGEKLVGGTIGTLGGRAVQSTAQRNLARAADAVGSYGVTRSRELAELAGSGKDSSLLGGVLGRAGISAFGALQQKGQKYIKSSRDEAKKALSSATKDQLMQSLRMKTLNVDGPLTWAGTDSDRALEMMLLEDKDFRKNARKEMGDDAVDKMLSPLLNLSDDELKAKGFESKQLETARSQNLHLLKDSVRTKFLASGKFNASDLSEVALKGDDEIIAPGVKRDRSGVRAALAAQVARTDENNNDISVLQDIQSNKYGVGLREAANASGYGRVFDAVAAEKAKKLGDQNIVSIGNTDFDPNENDHVDRLAAAMRTGDIDVRTLTTRNFEGVRGQALAKAVLQAGASSRVSNDKEVQAEFLKAVADTGLDKLAPGQLNQFRRLKLADADSVATKGALEGIFMTPGATGDIDGSGFTTVLKSDPKLINQQLVAAASKNDDLSKALLDSVDSRYFQSLADEYNRTVNSKRREEIQGIVSALSDVMKKHYQNIALEPGDAGRDTYYSQNDALNAAARRIGARGSYRSINEARTEVRTNKIVELEALESKEAVYKQVREIFRRTDAQDKLDYAAMRKMAASDPRIKAVLERVKDMDKGMKENL